MYGVALEGGGMRGAYHIGAMKAIYECGYDIGGYVGTSIGALNAAVLAQGDFEKLYDIWYKASTNLGIDVKEKEVEKLVSGKWDIKGLKYWTKFFTDTLSNKGIDNSRLKQLYTEVIDESKLRASNKDYGMVTVSFTDKKPIYLCKEDIPEGLIASYALASSYLPVFKQDRLLNDDKIYIDGGFYDNCPITILKDKGYKDIIEVRTGSIGINKKVKRKDLNIITIHASKDLGSILFSDNKSVKNNINMGYYDALRVLKGYIGDKFYVIPTKNEIVFNMLNSIADEKIMDIIKDIKLVGIKQEMEPKKILFEKIFPVVQTKLKHADTSSYQKLIVAMMEYISKDEITIYRLYKFEELLNEFKNKIPKYIKKEKDAIMKNQTISLMLNLIKNLEI